MWHDTAVTFGRRKVAIRTLGIEKQKVEAVHAAGADGKSGETSGCPL